MDEELTTNRRGRKPLSGNLQAQNQRRRDECATSVNEKPRKPRKGGRGAMQRRRVQLHEEKHLQQAWRHQSSLQEV